MKKPEIEVVRFGAEDVIATSVVWFNLGGDPGDNIVRFGGKSYGQAQTQDNEVGAAASALLEYYGYPNVDGNIAKNHTFFRMDRTIPGGARFDNLFNDTLERDFTSYNNVSFTILEYDSVNNRYWFYIHE